MKGDKIAQLAEHSASNIKLRDMGGNGTLPAFCEKDNGKLDFSTKDGKIVLVCRKCGSLVDID